MASGYALSRDGLWRQHSWVIDTEAARLVETTVPRERYFGVPLDEAEAVRFWFANFLVERYGGPLGLMQGAAKASLPCGGPTADRSAA